MWNLEIIMVPNETFQQIDCSIRHYYDFTAIFGFSLIELTQIFLLQLPKDDKFDEKNRKYFSI